MTAQTTRLNYRDSEASEGQPFSTAATVAPRWVIPVRGYATAKIQAREAAASAAWAAAVLSVEQSADGVTPSPLATPVSITTAARMTPAIDLTGIDYLIVEASTNEAGVLLELLASLYFGN
jgi:hypothetical protein